MAKIPGRVKTERCPECGGRKIGFGRFSSQSRLNSVTGKTFESGSEVWAEVCTHCGLILRQWVKDPERFISQKQKGGRW